MTHLKNLEIRERKLSGTSKLAANEDPNHFLKVLIWLYLLLWIFEGALRKWIIPALSTPLLLVRDPIVLWLFILVIRNNIIKFNPYLTGMLILGVVSFVAAIVSGHGNIPVAMYGARTLLLYFPMIFIIGAVFNEEDVIKMGKVILYIAIPMTLLLGLQFYSPQSAWVNKGIGGDDDGAGFGGALGYFRAPCTFSFTNGTTCFYSLVTPFVLYFWLNVKKINKNILIAATMALVIAVPLSISRALFFQVAAAIAFLLFAVSRKPKYFGKVVGGSVLIVIVLTILGNLPFFATATEVFTSRFDGANESEGGMVEGVIGDRFLGKLIKAVMGSSDQSVFGFGIGSGTALGAKLLNNDSVSSSADFEWMREIGEMGLMGLLLIGLRVGLSIKMALLSLHKLASDHILPWLLASVGVLVLTQGQWHQSTALGYCALVAGLWLASLKNGSKKKIVVNRKLLKLTK